MAFKKKIKKIKKTKQKLLGRQKLECGNVVALAIEMNHFSESDITDFYDSTEEDLEEEAASDDQTKQKDENEEFDEMPDAAFVKVFAVFYEPTLPRGVRAFAYIPRAIITSRTDTIGSIPADDLHLFDLSDGEEEHIPKLPGDTFEIEKLWKRIDGSSNPDEWGVYKLAQHRLPHEQRLLLGEKKVDDNRLASIHLLEHNSPIQPYPDSFPMKDRMKRWASAQKTIEQKMTEEGSYGFPGPLFSIQLEEVGDKEETLELKIALLKRGRLITFSILSNASRDTVDVRIPRHCDSRRAEMLKEAFLSYESIFEALHYPLCDML